MKTIRILIHKLLGTKGYVRLVSSIYMFLVRLGLLKSKYPELFYLKELIKPGDTCLDIGANVGYYTWFMRKACKSEGKVFAVEPVTMFQEIWKKRLRKYDNVVLYPYALGDKNQTVTMGTPSINGVVHHGMTHVLEENEGSSVTTHEAQMKIPDELFAELEHIHYLKIDVEGYESIVFSNMQKTVNRTSPIIQAELSGVDNRKNVISLLEAMAYKTCVLNNSKLIAASEEVKNTSVTDFYFIPEEKSFLLE